MKRIILICIYINILNIAKSQKSVLEAHKSIELVQGIDNPIRIMLEGINCDLIEITTDNGQISGKNCNFIINPEYVGIAEIKINKIIAQDTQLIEIRKIRVKPIPIPMVRISSKSSGMIGEKELKSQLGLYSIIEGYDICGQIRITRFRLIVMRGPKLMGVQQNKGGKFSMSTRRLLNETKPRDQVYFVDIYGERINKEAEEQKLQAIELTIKD